MWDVLWDDFSCNTPSNALTAVRVSKLAKPGRYAAGNGLYLIVDGSGAKRWVLRTVVHQRRRDMGLGSTRLVSLADARALAQEVSWNSAKRW